MELGLVLLGFLDDVILFGAVHVEELLQQLGSLLLQLRTMVEFSENSTGEVGTKCFMSVVSPSCMVRPNACAAVRKLIALCAGTLSRVWLESNVEVFAGLLKAQ